MALIAKYIFTKNDKEKAAKLIDYWQQTDPIDRNCMFYQGLLLFLIADYQKAEIQLGKAKQEFMKNNDDSPNYRMTLYCLAFIFIENKNKKFALEIITLMPQPILGADFINTAFVCVWDNNFERAFDVINKFIESATENPNQNYQDRHMERLILLLLAKKQYHFTLKLFENSALDLKDKFKPVYYALMHYLKDEYPNEYLKMGAELQQPVADVMERIKQMAIEYA